MRYYNPGDEIYMFGFSRGAYIARFLAEMLDFIGLLSHGNEEMVSFAWKAFSMWQCRQGSSDETLDEAEAQKKREMFRYMKGFRETFSRPVGRIRFLGLFDTVNSVPRFETAWMQRSKFPYTARSSAKVIRHAVSIDERRAKFRSDLMYQNNPKSSHHDHGHHRHIHVHDHHVKNMFRPSFDIEAKPNDDRENLDGDPLEQDRLGPTDNRGRQSGKQQDQARPKGDSEYTPYRPRSRSRRPDAGTDNRPGQPQSSFEQDEEAQSINEVWFSGGHGDIGGGWQAEKVGKNASHVPLVWMVREAMRAGLPFDLNKVDELDCLHPHDGYCRASSPNGMRKQPAKGPGIRIDKESGENEWIGPPSPETNVDNDSEGGFRSAFHELMHGSHTSKIHDSLAYGGGLSTIAVTAWNIMEWMPFRRMDLQDDGSWSPIRWPLPRGEVRDVPDNVRVHGSVIRRMQRDETYRPGNLIVGGGGRGVRRAPEDYGIGEWVCIAEHGDPVGEIWVRKKKPIKLEKENTWKSMTTVKSFRNGKRAASEKNEENGN